MTLAEAHALLHTSDVIVRDDAPHKDLAALGRLAQWALRFSPIVATDAPDGLMLDITGCKDVFRGEPRLVTLLSRGLNSLGLAAHIAVAPTFGCAWALARYGDRESVIVPDSQEALIEAVSPLPIEALRVDAGIVEALREVAVDRVAHALALPRRELPSRFGGSLLMRLDQVMGSAWERIEPVRPITPVRVERVFDGPTTQPEAIAITVRELIAELVRQLDERQHGVRGFTVELTRVDARPVRVSIQLSRASRSVKHLWTLIAPKLERANLGFGVDEVTMTATRTSRVRHQQSRQWDDDAGPDSHAAIAAVGELVDTLTNRLGTERVSRLCLRESHLPEQAACFVPALTHAPAKGVARTTPVDRPSVVLDPPEPIRVIAATPDGPIGRVQWRGTDHAILFTLGPERLSPEWWRASGDRVPAPATRDYFKVQNERGVWLWIFRELVDPCWFMHGVWA